MYIRSLIKVMCMLCCCSLSTISCVPDTLNAQDSSSDALEAAREEMITQWGSGGLPNPSTVDSLAARILSRPLVEQEETDLRELAKEANVVANLIGFIENEYEEYYRDNYRFDFIQEKVSPFLDNYRLISNKFKDYRNQAYFNLGKKAAQRGETAVAFFLFRDAHRLSSFVSGGNPREGMRYRAELEMKKLLSMEGIDTFATWQE